MVPREHVTYQVLETCKRKKEALDKKVLRLGEESVNPFCGI